MNKILNKYYNFLGIKSPFSKFYFTGSLIFLPLYTYEGFHVLNTTSYTRYKNKNYEYCNKIGLIVCFPIFMSTFWIFGLPDYIDELRYRYEEMK